MCCVLWLAAALQDPLPCCRRALTEFRRVLKQGGVAMFSGEPLGSVPIAPLPLQLPHLFICVATAQLDVK